MEELDVAIEAVKEAGVVVEKYYGKVRAFSKSDKSLTTKADTESEEAIKSIIKKRFPNHSILGEETGLIGAGSDYLWIIDPLDGTTNYSFQNPFFDISLALVHRDIPVIGVVLYPTQNELFYAERGKGAYLGFVSKTQLTRIQVKIRVSGTDSVENSIIAFCHGRDRESVKRMIEAFSRLKLVNNKVRQLGAAALELCYVACGRIDAFFMVGINSWDVAAGAVILKEAGGRVTDFGGKDFDVRSHDILGANSVLHQRLLKILEGV